MISLFRSLGLTRPCLLALLMLCLAPATVSAESLRFYNETNGVVVIQTSCIVRGAVQQGPRILVKPMEAAPPIMLPGNKIIAIYDDPRINPTRILFQTTIPAGIEDLSFNIVTDPLRKSVKIEPRR